MSQFDFDLIVIGGGSGGVRLARWSGGLGARVALIEEGRLGGTCVIRGCVPKKMMALGGHFTEEIEIMRDYGWSVDNLQLDFERFKNNRDKEISRLSGLYGGMLEKNNVKVFKGRGVIQGPQSVQVGDQTLSAKYICVAVGGAPYRVPVPGSELCWSSNEMFQLKEIPESLVVIGGGYIGVEFAGAFQGFGSKVTVLCRNTSILGGFDDDLRSFLTEEMKAKGIDLQVRQSLQGIEKLDNGRLRVVTATGSWDADGCLMATGRRPYTQNLGLENADIKVDPSGAIVVDDNYKTSCDSIYALGDVMDRVNLTPVATAEGTVLAENLFGDGKRSMSYQNIPTAVFSHPPLATVGLSEQAAKKQFKNVDVYKSTFRNLKMTLSEGGERTYMKMVVDGDTQRVLGCHMVGMDAPEIIQGMAIAIKAGASKMDFDATIGIHPTSAEEFVTMRTKS